MTIAHAAIVAKVAAILGAAGSLSGVTIYRNRLRPLGEDSAPAIVVRKASSDPDTAAPLIGRGIDWQTLIRVECYARAPVTQTAHEPADDLLAAVHAAIVANPTLDGLCMGVSSPRLGWDEADFDVPMGCAIAQYMVLHRTAPNSLEAAA